MSLTDEQQRKLARLHNRRTLYEIVMVNLSTLDRVLLCYSGKSGTHLRGYIRKAEAEVAAFCGDAVDGKLGVAAGLNLDHLVLVGNYAIGYSGRTQRECILNAELPWFKRAAA